MNDESSKLQKRSNPQAPTTAGGVAVWSLNLRTSLGFGPWNLVLYQHETGYCHRSRDAQQNAACLDRRALADRVAVHARAVPARSWAAVCAGQGTEPGCLRQ